MTSRELVQAATQRVTGIPEQSAVATQVVQQPHAFGVRLTAESAAQYLDFRHCQHPVRAFRAWAARVPSLRKRYRGDVPLWSRVELDRVIEHGPESIAPRATKGVGNSDKRRAS